MKGAGFLLLSGTAFAFQASYVFLQMDSSGRPPAPVDDTPDLRLPYLCVQVSDDVHMTFHSFSQASERDSPRFN